MKKRILTLVLALTLLLQLFAAPVSAAYTTEEIVEAALQLLYYNEGSYGSINKDDNGAVSIGKIQWHANRALNLLKTIVEADPEEAEAILGSELYNEIVTSKDWTKRTVTAEEAAVLKELLTTEQGKAAQDALATKDVGNYIKRGQNLGINDAAVLVYFADLENQGGSGMSTRVAKAASVTAGSYGAITLDIIHNAALEDSVAGKYSARRNKTYNYCKKLQPAVPEEPGVNFDVTITPGTTGARLEGKVSYTGPRPAVIGYFLGTSKDNMFRFYRQELGGNANPYEIELSISNLAIDKTYYLQFYYEIDGSIEWDSTCYSFTTQKDTKTRTVNAEIECGYKVTISRGYYVQCFDSPTSTTEASHIPEQNTDYTLFCTKRVVLSDYSVRYYYTDANGQGWYFNYNNKIPIETGSYGMIGSEQVHNHKTVTAPATCTESGYVEKICACGDSFISETLPPANHTYVNGTCTGCGKQNDGVLLGDANGDGNVDNVDAMLILQYAVGLKNGSELNLAACNVDGTGGVDNVDAMMILQYAVGLLPAFPIAQ